MVVVVHGYVDSTHHLFVLDDTDLGGPEDTAVEAEALLLGVEDGVVLLVGHGGHEGGFVLVGVELLAVGVVALKPVILQRLHQNVLGHLETIIKIDQILEVLILLLGLELLLGHHGQCAVKVVYAVDQILGELLDRKVASSLHVTRCAILEVAEVGDRAEVLVLQDGALVGLLFRDGRREGKTNLPVPNLGILRL